MNYENLVLEGGGVKGIAYAGAVEVLHEHGIFEKIKRVAGTSAGSIMAALISLGYDPGEITSIVSATNFASFEDGKCYLRIPFTYGLYKGDAFLDWMKDKVAKKMGNPEATFADLEAKGLREIRVFATDLNMKTAKEFSHRKTPDVRLAEAVRASMSIPIFFKAWQFPDGNPDNHIYVDGGTVFNYPLTTFDTDGPNAKTLGLHLDNLKAHPVDDQLQFREFGQYIKDLFDTLLKSQVIDFEKDPEMEKRTIRIDDLGISATDFNLTDAQQKALYNSGKECTQAFLQNHPD